MTISEAAVGGSRSEDATHTLLHDPARVRKPPHSEVAHYVVVVAGSEQGKHLEAGLEPITVGRHGDNRLALADPFVSGHHCIIAFEKGCLWVADSGSTNGTFIDGARIVTRMAWPMGASLQVGNQILRQEFRRRDALSKPDDLLSELQHAATYVRALLPAPLPGGPVAVSWQFLPCAELGGDIFDYFWLDAERFVFYLLDVCGHGIGAALHSVSVFNLLRQRFLRQVDFANPAEVLDALNRALPMEVYAGMYFTVWYGVYDAAGGTLNFASAGHPPGLVFMSGRESCLHLSTDDPPIGVMANAHYQQNILMLPPSSRLYLYSDGVYELPMRSGGFWEQADFVRLLREEVGKGCSTPESIMKRILAETGAHHFDDDFSLLSLQFGAGSPRS